MSESKLDIWLLIKTDMYADNSQNKEVNSKKKNLIKSVGKYLGDMGRCLWESLMIFGGLGLRQNRTLLLLVVINGLIFFIVTRYQFINFAFLPSYKYKSFFYLGASQSNCSVVQVGYS